MEMLSDGLFRRIRYGANARKPRCTLTTALPPRSSPCFWGYRRRFSGGFDGRDPAEFHDALRGMMQLYESVGQGPAKDAVGEHAFPVDTPSKLSVDP
jgi:hypothetical protein